MAESLWRPGHVVSAIAIMGATAVLVAQVGIELIGARRQHSGRTSGGSVVLRAAPMLSA